MNYSVESNSRKHENVRRLAHKSFSANQSNMESSNVINTSINNQHSSKHSFEIRNQYGILHQNQFINDIPKVTKRKSFDLSLENPAVFDYSMDSTVLNLATMNGDLSMINLKTFQPIFNINTNERINSLKSLHDNRLLAVAHKRNVQIYDERGTEIHNVLGMKKIRSMVFLPYFQLLCGVSLNNQVQWLDITNGKIVESVNIDSDTYPASRIALDYDKSNGISQVGHTNGTVCSYSPNSKSQLSKLQANDSCIVGLKVSKNSSGQSFIYTLGSNRKLKIFDIRNNQECLNEVSLPASPYAFDVSATGKIAVSLFDSIDIFNDLTSGTFDDYGSCLQQSEKVPSRSSINDLHFMNFEDILGCAHSRGFSSFVVPGSGERKLDNFEQVNPNSSKKHKDNLVIKSLINKINQKMISIDIENIGKADTRMQDVKAQEEADNQDAVANLNKDKAEINKMSSKDGLKRKRQKDILREQKIREEIKKRNLSLRQTKIDEEETTDQAALLELEEKGLL